MVHGGDPADTALLVFARTAMDARKLAWRILVHEYGVAECYTDVRAKWIKGGADWHLDPELKDTPHVVEPRTCERCECWYPEGLRDDGFCQQCGDDYDYEKLEGWHDDGD